MLNSLVCRMGRLSWVLAAVAIPMLVCSRSVVSAAELASAEVSEAEHPAALLVNDERETSELEHVRHLRAKEYAEAYDACPYAFLSKDYFARFTRDPDRGRLTMRFVSRRTGGSWFPSAAIRSQGSWPIT